MRITNQLSRLVIVLLACVAALAFGGCGSSRFKGDDGKTGTLNAALQTTGTDGATYRFIDGSLITITGVTVSGSTAYPIDSTATVFTKSLGPGGYALDLLFPGYTTPHLSRTAGGVTTIVEATWTDVPKPLPFTIVASQPTNVTLHFNVPGFGDVTFSPGTLAVDMAVNNTTSTKPSSITLTGTMTATSVSNDPSSTYTDAFGTYVSNGTPMHPTVIVTPMPGEEWSLDIQSACIMVNVTDTSAPEPPLAARLDQVEGGSGRLCIADEGASDRLMLDLSMNGPPPASQTSSLPGTSYIRYVDIAVVIGDVFDGTTLDQAKLGAGVPISSGDFLHQLINGSSGTVMTQAQGAFSAGTVSAKP
jgi:hypothetical protein